MPRWKTKHERAAFLLAEGVMNAREIAETLRMGESTLHHWKSGRSVRRDDFLEFPERVRTLRAELLAQVRAQGIAVLEQRVKRASDDWQRLQQIRRERAAKTGLGDVPGGSTGLLIRTVKSVGRGDAAQLIEEYEIDHALLSELRALENQVARELGAIPDSDEPREIVVRYVDGHDD
ncbi:MAG TPA: hypothetical protein VFW40_11385 [Capsulimonadaceae bacterium]|nr:hypothetical protein [Capsulimonadaceae bacterium]